MYSFHHVHHIVLKLVLYIIFLLTLHCGYWYQQFGVSTYTGKLLFLVYNVHLGFSNHIKIGAIHSNNDAP